MGKIHGHLAGKHDVTFTRRGVDAIILHMVVVTSGSHDILHSQLLLHNTHRLADNTLSQSKVNLTAIERRVGVERNEDSFKFTHTISHILRHILQYFGSESDALTAHLVSQDATTKLQIGTFDLSRQTPFEAGDETVFDTLQHHRRTVAGHDKLLAVLVQVIEDMKEGVLRLLHTDKFLNIVNNQYINALIEVNEIVERILTHRVGVLHLKQMSRNIQHAFLGIELLHLQTDGIGQVSLSHTRCTIKEQGIEYRLSRLQRNTLSSGTGQLIAQALNEVIKAIVTTQHGVEVLYGNGNGTRGSIIALFLFNNRLCRLLLRLLINGKLVLAVGKYTIIELGTLSKGAIDGRTKQIDVVCFNVLIHELTGYKNRQHTSLIRCRLGIGEPRVERRTRNILADNAQAFAPKFCELSFCHGYFCSFSFTSTSAKLHHIFYIFKQLFLPEYLQFSKALTFKRLRFLLFFASFFSCIYQKH